MRPQLAGDGRATKQDVCAPPLLSQNNACPAWRKASHSFTHLFIHLFNKLIASQLYADTGDIMMTAPWDKRLVLVPGRQTYRDRQWA